MAEKMFFNQEEPEIEMGAVRRIVLLVWAVLGTTALFYANQRIIPYAKQDIDTHLLFIAVASGIALVVTGGVHLCKKPQYLGIGNLKSHTQAVKIFGIKKDDNWRSIGIIFALLTAVATLGFLVPWMGLELRGIPLSAWFFSYLLAVPFAFLYALSESLVIRWVIAEACSGSWARYAPWVAAVVYGAFHFFALPFGPYGLVMGFILGWMMTRSIHDTQGVGWVWITCFVQYFLVYATTFVLVL